MAEASPICRGKNLTIETILAFVNAMPTHSMKKSEFHEYTEKKLKGWTQTHSQIARQVALYYEYDGVCYPRFDRKVTYFEVLKYMLNWAKLYFVPNMYTPSLTNPKHKATNIYAFLKSQVLEGEKSFSKACTRMFGIELNNTDKVRVFLNNFTDLVISDDVISKNSNLASEDMPIIYPNVDGFDAKAYFDYFKTEDINAYRPVKSTLGFVLQQIYYGAPGTGKSFELKEITKGYSIIRTTFHPDSDYSTFVGAYKPVMTECTVYGPQGEPIKISKGQEKVDLKEKRITYTYVKQAFLKAYLGAWQKYAKGGETVDPQFLVIEEINRGNCAQIFGDLFQLLDRNDNGFSTYPIEADSDLQKEITKAFGEGGEYALAKGFDVDGVVDEYTSNYGGTLSDDIKNGRVLLLPNNFYIWATMNTSDQSLFPIDSAFKRRWDWRYVKIADAHKGWKIKCGDEYCDWWTFVEEINKLIAKETSSDDKKLGYFFCKPIKGSDTITEDKFVGKVLFYLWNDVFKDGDISLFKVSDDEKAEICFDAFYNSDNKVDVAAIRRFLVSVVGDDNLKSNDEADDEALEAAITGGNVDKSQYSFNGGGKYWKSTLGLKIMETYLSQHKELTFDQIKETFPDSMLNGIPGPGLIVKAEVDLASYSRYYRFGYESSDGIKFSIYKQWTRGNVPAIIEFAKNQNWTVEKL